jgi:hypothetical protein
MSQAVPAYVSRIRKQLRAAEAASDASLLANLELMRSIIVSRQTEDAPTPYVGQQALIRLLNAAKAQIATSNDIFRAHEELHRVAKQELMVAGEEDKPTGFMVPDDAASTRVA